MIYKHALHTLESEVTPNMPVSTSDLIKTILNV